jgi:N-acetylglucosamine malate deacetylase 2
VTPTSSPAGRMPVARSVLAVCAHPDDESFGLGAALDAYRRTGTPVAVVTCTAGEASTLGDQQVDLGTVRRIELERAGAELGVTTCTMLDHADGSLAEADGAVLASEVGHVARAVAADLLLVFDEGGITGHPDHVAATAAALDTARRAGLPVLAWTLPLDVAAQLNREFGTAFVGREAGAIDLEVAVDRSTQHRAIRCHASQARDNPVLWRRLELQGPTESFRWLAR